MNDLRKAAEMALETLETTWGNGSEGTLKQWEETIQALRQALNVDAVNMSQKSIDETANGEHEPVCFLRETNWSYEIAPWDDPNGIPVYTAPPKREWVGLTDVNEMVEAELTHYWNGEYELTTGARNHLTDFAQAIEAKLKEKNT